MSPKYITPEEITRIKAKLYEKGTQLLLIHGVKKTNVEDITKAAGISKGSFYHYFNSKEEFFFDIFEQFHENMQKDAFEVIGNSSADNLKDQLKQFLINLFMDEQNAAFFLRSADLEYLLYKLPPEKIAAHVAEDNDMMVAIIRHTGIEISEEVGMIVSNIMKVIFLARCSSEMLNQSVMRQTVELLVGNAIDYVFERKG